MGGTGFSPPTWFRLPGSARPALAFTLSPCYPLRHESLGCSFCGHSDGCGHHMGPVARPKNPPPCCSNSPANHRVFPGLGYAGVVYSACKKCGHSQTRGCWLDRYRDRSNCGLFRHGMVHHDSERCLQNQERVNRIFVCIPPGDLWQVLRHIVIAWEEPVSPIRNTHGGRNRADGRKCQTGGACSDSGSHASRL